jgi:hypothetical protein
MGGKRRKTGKTRKTPERRRRIRWREGEAERRREAR